MHVFIGGAPTAGKTHLARDFTKQSDGAIHHIKVDDIREELRTVPEVKKWANFFKSQDETAYWKRTDCKQHLQNIIDQSNALWPHILKKIKESQKQFPRVIFEGIDIMPELAHRDLDFDGFFLVPPDVETMYVRLQAHRRWGETNDLKRQEAKCFYEGDAMYIKQEAEKYGYEVFDNLDDGYSKLSELFN